MEQTIEKRDSYTVVTDRIIELLKLGIVPWRKNWAKAGLPMNLATGRPYKGINVMLLASLNYKLNYFLTYKQVKELGGEIKKGEKSNLVVFWTYSNSINGEAQLPQEEVHPPKLQYYTVFNVEQCEGLPEDKIPALKQEAYPIVKCEDIVKKMPNKPTISHKAKGTCYDPLKDVITLPKREVFSSGEPYFYILFHMLIHSTGHFKRLNRKGLLEMAEYGANPFSYEEMVAEIGAAYLESTAGIAEPEPVNEEAYIKGWLQVLEHDKRFILSASGYAQKATDYILHVTGEEKEEEPTALNQ